MPSNDPADATGHWGLWFLANVLRLRHRGGDRAPRRTGGRRAHPKRTPRGRVVGARRLDSVGSHDYPGAGSAVVVRSVADSRLPPGRRREQRRCGRREHRVRDRLGVDRLRAVVTEWYGRGATLARELTF